MSFLYKVKKFFGNRAETREDHIDETLQSRYYKTTKDRGFDALENLFSNSQSYQINSVSKDHGEISLIKTKGKKAFIVITVIMVSPFKTSVDFSVSSESIIPFDFGYSSKLIQELYALVDKELPLITN